MEKNEKIILTIVGIAATVGIGALIYKSVKSKTPNALGDHVDVMSAKFKKFVSIAKAKGSDLFDGIDATKMAELEKQFTTRLSPEQADAIITIAGKKEADWTPAEKANFVILFGKWTGKILKS